MRAPFLFAILLIFSGIACAQSGRAKGSTGKWPIPIPRPIAAPSPSPDPAKPGRPPLPKFVDGERIYTTRELDERADIVSKPNPIYPPDARRHAVHGVVVLRAILAADETVKHIEVVTGLPYGLTEKAIAAAQQIKFKPGQKDGKPVSAWVGLEYHFDLY